MKLRFVEQSHQYTAFCNITELFHGEGDIARAYFRHATMLLDNIGNTLPIPVDRIQSNLHAVQRRNGLPLIDIVNNLLFCIGMETDLQAP